jgi:hypothetical protein
LLLLFGILFEPVVVVALIVASFSLSYFSAPSEDLARPKRGEIVKLAVEPESDASLEWLENGANPLSEDRVGDGGVVVLPLLLLLTNNGKIFTGDDADRTDELAFGE